MIHYRISLFVFALTLITQFINGRNLGEAVDAGASVLHLHLGATLIQTTGEHPFYRYHEGWNGDGVPGTWVKASELVAGDYVIADDGSWVEVTEAWDTGEFETVYNLTIEEYHTYFVAESAQGPHVWAHNTYEQFKAAIDSIFKKKGKKLPLQPILVREWHDKYVVTFTSIQSVLVNEFLKSKLQIVGRKEIGRIIDAATNLDGVSGPYKTRIMKAADNALSAFSTDLVSSLHSIGIDDAVIGYRGSVARGEKNIEAKLGYPIDWDDSGLDLFILSDKLANLSGDFVDATSLQSIQSNVIAVRNAIRSRIEGSGVLPSGKHFGESYFKVMSKDKLKSKTKPTNFQEGGVNLTQANPARVLKNGVFITYNKPEDII